MQFLFLLFVWAGLATAENSMLPQTGTTVGATTNRILRSNSLTLEVEYLRLFHDMSMKNPDSKDGKMNKCKPSKKGNGKGIDRGRSKGKGKGKGKGLVEEDCPEEAPSQAPAPVVAPTPGPAGPVVPSNSPVMASTPPMMAPTANVTMAPTTGGTPNASSSNLVFSPFSVFYTIEQTTIPTTIEINELAVFTNSYLTVFLQAAYEASGQILLLESSTVLTGQQFLIGQPVQVDYNSTLTFAPTSPIVPTVEEVTVILASAFAGTNGEAHIQTLRADLSPENIFATTSQLTFQPIVASTNGTSRARVIAGSVSVVAVILMIAVVGVYRRKGYQPIEETKMEQMTLGGDSTCDDHTVDSQSQVSATYRFDGAKSLNPSNMEWIVYQSANDGQVEREVEEHETKNGDDTDTLGVAGENSQE